jgi:hypothetical protein
VLGLIVTGLCEARYTGTFLVLRFASYDSRMLFRAFVNLIRSFFKSITAPFDFKKFTPRSRLQLRFSMTWTSADISKVCPAVDVNSRLILTKAEVSAPPTSPPM